MPGIAKATYSQLEAARYESKHAVKLGEEDDGRLSPVVALLKLVMIFGLLQPSRISILIGPKASSC